MKNNVIFSCQCIRAGKREWQFDERHSSAMLNVQEKLQAECKKADGSYTEGKKACSVSCLPFFNWIVISATLH
jgi:copper oxidase (laccase) domain-containing protein